MELDAVDNLRRNPQYERESMPVQQQTSSFGLGGLLTEITNEHRDKPIDTGNRRLPSGIKVGIAKLSTLYAKQYEDDKQGVKGKYFVRASAIVVSPTVHEGERIAGMVTSVVIPLCTIPPKGESKGSDIRDNIFKFQNLIKMLSDGKMVNPETPATDPTGQKGEAFFIACMAALTDPARTKTHPIYVVFSTRGWTPPLSPADKAAGKKENEEMVFETWHNLATPEQIAEIGKVDPAAGMADSTAARQPSPMSPPPTQNGQKPSPQPPPPAAAATPADEPMDPADEVAGLVEVAMSDPRGQTEDGKYATARLEDMAVAAGWTKEQAEQAADWAAVGKMILNPPSAAPAQQAPAPTNITPAVGAKFLYAKRTKDGQKFKDANGKEFPTIEVEVVAVDTTAKTCTLKAVKDSKPIIDIRTRQPVAVKWEWLEGPPY